MKIAEVMQAITSGIIYQIEEVNSEGQIVICETKTGISICGGDLRGYYNNAQEVLERAAELNKSDTEFEPYKTRADLKAENAAMKSEIRRLQVQLKNKTNEARHYLNALEKVRSC